MLAGFDGHLLSEFFLEQCVEHSAHDATEVRRSLERWRRSTNDLGPASSPRALLEAGARPLLNALGVHVDGSVTLLKRAAIATAAVHEGSDRLVVVATGWGEPLDPLWRPAIESAAR